MLDGRDEAMASNRPSRRATRRASDHGAPRLKRPPELPAKVPPGTHTLTIPRWTPTTLNRLLRMHWSARQRRLRADADLLAVYSLLQKVPKAAGKRRVAIELTVGLRSHRPDCDNVLKSSFDALVKAGLLLDDGPDACELGAVVVRFGRGRETTFTLQDLEG